MIKIYEAYNLFIYIYINYLFITFILYQINYYYIN